MNRTIDQPATIVTKTPNPDGWWTVEKDYVNPNDKIRLPSFKKKGKTYGGPKDYQLSGEVKT